MGLAPVDDCRCRPGMFVIRCDKLKEDHLSAEESINWGPLSNLADVRQVTANLVDLLSSVFADYEPEDEGGVRVVFTLAASLQSGGIGEDEIGDAIREAYLALADRPRAQWEIELNYEDATRIALALVASRGRPDTQIIGPSHLEMLVRDDTTHSILLPPTDNRAVIEFATDGGQVTATVGAPNVELLVRCALRREGLDRLAVLDGERGTAFCRIKRSVVRSLTEVWLVSLR